MEVKIEKMDHEGNGIAYVDNIVTFVPKTVPEDLCQIKIIKFKKKYNKAKLLKVVKDSPKRVKAFCPYYDLCGGCHLQNFSYDDSLTYKKDTLINIFKKIHLDIDPIIIKNEDSFNYRNKIELKISDKQIGFYEENTHNIVKVNNCLITKECINKVMPFISKFNIINGNIIIRCNSNDEILLVINTKDILNIDVDELKQNIKLVGIVLNNKTIYGENFLYERINKIIYKISFDSFFQVNTYMAEKLFSIVDTHIEENARVLDLYSGVGTFSLTAAKKGNEVVGIEIVPNAVLNSIFNAKINKLDNVHFVLNSVEEAIDKIDGKFDTWIIDPPRSGIDKTTINAMLEHMPSKIIYISCNPHSLVRDIELLMDKYMIEKVYLCDLFSYTYHLESICVLNIRKEK